MRLYLVRHGESETNRKKCWTGWLDVPLTEKGEADALSARKIIDGVKFDKIYSSDLIRARKTAEIAIPGCTPELDALLREVNIGSLSGKMIDKNSEEFKSLSDGYAAVGGESTAEFRARIRAFMKKMEAAGEETVIAFSHGGWLRGMLSEVIGAEFSRGIVRCANCTVAIFEFANEAWSLHSWIGKSE